LQLKKDSIYSKLMQFLYRFRF